MTRSVLLLSLLLWIVCSLCSAAAVVRSGSSVGDTEIAISLLEKKLMAPEVAMVPLTLIQGAGSKGAGNTLSLSLVDSDSSNLDCIFLK